MNPTDWLKFLEDIADQADQIALRFFRKKNLHIETKGDLSPVTEADKAIEEAAYELVQKNHPGLGFFGEEQGEVLKSDGARLIIDPIDATRNFMRGIPLFATLLAIEEGGEIIAGLVGAAGSCNSLECGMRAGRCSKWPVNRGFRNSGVQVFASVSRRPERFRRN